VEWCCLFLQIAAAAKHDRSAEPSKNWLTLLTIAYVCAGVSNTVNITFTSLITECKTGYLNAIRAAFLVNIISNLIMVVSVSYAAITISSLMFGFAFMGIVSLTLTIIGNKYRYRATQVMAQLTLGYCLAQIISPIIVGVIAEQSGNFNLALIVISGVMAIGMISLTIMKRE